jgi:hypothetical protein
VHVAKDGVHQGGLAGTDTADHADDLSGLAGELRDVEGEVLLAVVLELGVALQDSRKCWEMASAQGSNCCCVSDPAQTKSQGCGLHASLPPANRCCANEANQP